MSVIRSLLPRLRRSLGQRGEIEVASLLFGVADEVPRADKTQLVALAQLVFMHKGPGARMPKVKQTHEFVTMIPAFHDLGYLPPGVHGASLTEIGQRFGQESE